MEMRYSSGQEDILKLLRKITQSVQAYPDCL